MGKQKIGRPGRIAHKKLTFSVLYQIRLKETVSVKDAEFVSHELKAGTVYNVLYEARCANGIHLRLQAGLNGPSWVHSNQTTKI